MIHKLPNIKRPSIKDEDLDQMFGILSEAIQRDKNDLYYIAEDEILDEATLSGTDPHEVITATLCVMGKSAINDIISELKVSLKNEELMFEDDASIDGVLQNIEAEAREMFPAADGVDKKQIDSISSSGAPELAAAISAALGILDNFMRVEKSEKAYLTGGKWDAEIEKFKIEVPGMKDYNSSDLVLKYGNIFYGASLKKKATKNAGDPTLLNNALGRALTPLSTGSGESAKIISSMLSDLEESKNEFWNSVVTDLHKKFHTGKMNEASLLRHKEGEKKYDKDKKALADFIENKNQKFGGRDWTKAVNAVDTRLLAPYLTSSKSIFKQIDEIIVKYASSLAPLLLDVILKLRIYDLKKDDFNFGLVTGIGQKTKTKGFIVEKAKIIGLPALYEKMVELNVSSPSITKRKGKVQAFEDGATAAKLYYTVKYGDTEVVHLELRYKGSYTADPQFFAIFADSFQKYLLEQESSASGVYKQPPVDKLLTKARPKTTDKGVEEKFESSESYQAFTKMEAHVEAGKAFDASGLAVGVRTEALSDLQAQLEKSGMPPIEAKQKARAAFGLLGEEREN